MSSWKRTLAAATTTRVASVHSSHRNGSFGGGVIGDPGSSFDGKLLPILWFARRSELVDVLCGGGSVTCSTGVTYVTEVTCEASVCS